MSGVEVELGCTFLVGMANTACCDAVVAELKRRGISVIGPKAVLSGEHAAGVSVAMLCTEILGSSADGERLIGSLREANSKLRIVVISMAPSWTEARRAFCLGVDDFVAMTFGARVAVDVALGEFAVESCCASVVDEATVLAHYRGLVLHECGGSMRKAARLLGRSPYALRRSMRADEEFLSGPDE